MTLIPPHEDLPPGWRVADLRSLSANVLLKMPERQAVQKAIGNVACAATPISVGSGASEVRAMSEQDDKINNVIGSALLILAAAWLVAYTVVAIRAWLF